MGLQKKRSSLPQDNAHASLARSLCRQTWLSGWARCQPRARAFGRNAFGRNEKSWHELRCLFVQRPCYQSTDFGPGARFESPSSTLVPTRAYASMHLNEAPHIAVHAHTLRSRLHFRGFEDNPALTARGLLERQPFQ